jgi:hypothetical protein
LLASLLVFLRMSVHLIELQLSEVELRKGIRSEIDTGCDLNWALVESSLCMREDSVTDRKEDEGEAALDSPAELGRRKLHGITPGRLGAAN